MASKLYPSNRDSHLACRRSTTSVPCHPSQLRRAKVTMPRLKNLISNQRSGNRRQTCVKATQGAKAEHSNELSQPHVSPQPKKIQEHRNQITLSHSTKPQIHLHSLAFIANASLTTRTSTTSHIDNQRALFHPTNINSKQTQQAAKLNLRSSFSSQPLNLPNNGLQISLTPSLHSKAH